MKIHRGTNRNKQSIKKSVAAALFAVLIVLPLVLSLCEGRAAAGGYQTAAHCPLEQIHEIMSHFDLMDMSAPLSAVVSGQYILLLSVFLICVLAANALMELTAEYLFKWKCNNYIHHMNPWSFWRDLLAGGVMHPKIY